MTAAPKFDPTRLAPEDVEGLSDDALRMLMSEVIALQAEDRKESQILYYQPASEDCRQVHLTDARYIGIGGGNGSSKTDTSLVEIIACCTGVIPLSVPEIRRHFRGPINCRIVVESLTTTLHTIILPKLQWWKWSGVSQPGGDKGHWGWIPKLSLIDASWDVSWSEKVRMLRMICRDPDNWNRVLGESTIQFMSHEQDPTDFASGDFHIVLHDEPTKHAIWVENQARTMRVDGRVMLAMTWPDDPAIPVDWIFDELYEPGQKGPKKSPHHEWIELDTRMNRNLLQDAVERQAQNWSSTIRDVRLGGRPIRFSNRIHPMFTDRDDWWSFEACKPVIPKFDANEQPVCPVTLSRDVVAYNHVAPIESSRTFPTIFLLDPHPRKPHCYLWVQVNANDDYDVIMESQLNGTPDEVAREVAEIERAMSLRICLRMMDPNMGASPSRSTQREITWRQEFADAGLSCDLADDSDVGRSRVNEYLQPDRYTLRPRLMVAERCQVTIFQMKRYCWDDHKRVLDRDLKQVPKAKNDDFPTLLKYLMNRLPTFRDLVDGPQVMAGFGQRTRPY